MLSRIYAVQGKWREAAEAADTLLAAQRELADTDAADRAQALIRSADARLANGDYDEAVRSVEQAIKLAPQLDLEAGIAAYTDLAVFYLPNGPAGLGGDLLDGALRGLAAHPDKESLPYARAAVKLGTALNSFARWEETVPLLYPLVEAAERRFDAHRQYDELWRWYDEAASTTVSALESLHMSKEADRLREASGVWPTMQRPSGGEYEHPRLTRHLEPQYTEGARKNKIQGTVSLSIIVGTDGRAHEIEVLRSLPYGLSWESVRAVRRWRFRPATVDGEAVASRAGVEINFYMGSRL